MKAVRKAALLSAVAALSLVPSAALALDGIWSGNSLVNGNYADPFNWAGFVIPGAGDRAIFSSFGTVPRNPVFGTGTTTNSQALISGQIIASPWTFFGSGGGGENWRVINDITLNNAAGNANAVFNGVDVFAGSTNIFTGCSIQVTGSSSYNSDVALIGNGSFTVDSGNTLRGAINHQSTSTSFVSGLLDTGASQIVNGGVLGIAPSGHIFLNGGIHTVSNGVLGFQNSSSQLTFDAGAELRVSGSGSVDFLGSHEFENGAAIRVTSGGRVVGASFLDLGISGTGSVSVDGAGSSFAAPNNSFWGGGTSGVATVTFSNSGVGTLASLDIAQSSGSRGDVQLLSGGQLVTTSGLRVGPGTGTSSLARITVNGGNLNSNTTSTFRNGGQLVMSAGSVNFAGDATFSTGSTFTMSGGAVNLTAGRTLNIAGGIVNRTAGSGLSSLPNGSTLRITNGGQFTTNSFYDIANGASTGTMLVDGTGSRFNSTSGTTDWGQNAGNFATITFSNNGVGTYATGLQIADGGGRAVVNLLSSGQLNAAGLVVGGTASSATINIAGGTLNTLNAAQFNNGALVNFTSGGLLLNGNTTFNTGATLNKTGGNLTLAAGQTLAFSGGVGTNNTSMTLPNGASIRVTNGGRFDLGGFLDIANGVATGSLAVDGANSRITAPGTSDWGASAGNTATATFSNSGAGTFNTLRLARFDNGTANLSVSTNATLTAANFEAGSTGATALIQANGGTINVTGPAIFDNGANVSTSGTGVLRLGGNSTFFTSSTFNGTSSAANSGLQWADGTTLAFDGGAGTIAAIGSGIPNNGSLRITNAGSFTAKENFNIGNGSLVVDGTNSKFITQNTTSGINFWGQGATVRATFSNGGAGTMAGALQFANFGGTGTLDVSSGGLLQANLLTAGETGGTATINANGGTLRSTGNMQIATNGTGTVAVSGGGLIEANLMAIGQTGTTTTNVNSGTLRSTGAMQIAGSGGTATVNVAAGGTIQADGGLFTTFSGLGTATINVNGGTLRTTGPSNVNGGTTLNFAAGTVNIGGTLGVGIENPNARVLLTPGGDKVLRVGGLNIPAANNGKVDLSDNDMIIDYTGASPLGTIRGFLNTGRNGGNWLGNGLTSSAAALDSRTALGLVEATQLGSPATFFGQPIDNTTLLTRYTLYGDGDLSGTVNISDFAFLAANFNVATNSWFLGDYNYDGTTGIGDFALLASNFNLSLPGDLPRGGAVPEPGTLGLLGALALTLQRRCRAKK